MESSEKNLQGKSFKGQNLADADFSEADLRGADFTAAVLTNADFSKCKIGLKSTSAVWIFIFALIVSLLSGYLAMLTGATVQLLLKSPEQNLVISGYIILVLIMLFVLLAIFKGVGTTSKAVFVTAAVILIFGLVVWLSGAGSGTGALYGSLALILFIVMIFVGVIARTAAGALSSNIIFLIVAMGGGMFGKSLGGGIGTVILAVACAIISKRILSGSSEFTAVKKFALKAGVFFGTSFKNANLTGANFSGAVIKNANFAGAVTDGIKQENAVKKFNLGNI